MPTVNTTNHYCNKDTKPLTGLEPRNTHEKRRMSELLAAMGRYADADKDIPKEWIQELNELFGYANYRPMC